MMWKKNEVKIIPDYSPRFNLMRGIANHYAVSKKTLVIPLTPREIWELLLCVGVCEYEFNDWRAFHEGKIKVLWFDGAKLVRVEIE